MKRILWTIKILFITIMIQYLPITEVSCTPYYPLESIILDSTFIGQETEFTSDSSNWEIIPQNTENQLKLSFYKNTKHFADIILEKDAKGRRSIKLLNTNKTTIHHTYDAFLPMDGFSIPFHMIDPDVFIDDLDNFTIRQMAGNRIFSKSYHVERQEVSFEQAVENEWIQLHSIDTENQEESFDLILYIITDSNGKIIFKQLWNKEEPWWLYEETSNAKTWKRLQ